MPMRHQCLVMPIIPAKFGQIVGVILSLGEQFGKAGQAVVGGIADRMDDERVRQRQVDKPGEEEIRR